MTRDLPDQLPGTDSHQRRQCFGIERNPAQAKHHDMTRALSRIVEREGDGFTLGNSVHRDLTSLPQRNRLSQEQDCARGLTPHRPPFGRSDRTRTKVAPDLALRRTAPLNPEAALDAGAQRLRITQGHRSKPWPCIGERPESRSETLDGRWAVRGQGCSKLANG